MTAINIAMRSGTGTAINTGADTGTNTASHTTATTLTLNGRPTTVHVDPGMPLLWLLRGELALTGTKFGCGMGLCGACTVHVAGEPLRACSTPLSAVAGQAVVTIEGLQGRVADAVRAAWLALDVVQCGYCQSGQMMSAAALLQRLPAPSDADIDLALAGNLCRCGTYPRIRAAIHRAAAALAA